MLLQNIRSLTWSLFVLNLAFLVSCQKPTKSPEAYETNPSLTDADLGQLLMVGFRGQEIDSVSALVKEQLRSGEIGHTILFDFDYVNKVFDRNIVSVAQVQQYLRDIQALAPAPMFKAIDQEGGRVLRLKPDYGYATLPSAQYLGELNDVDSTRFYGKVNAQQLQNSGFNVNFAPVVDLNVNPENPVIGGIERSFGATTEQVVQHAAAWIQPHADAGVLSVLKHFPGHGSSQADSHKGIADVTASWTEEELRPFKLLLDSVSLTAVMTAHVFNRSIDSIYPATLSPHYIKSMLREDISYEGIVFSDDMHMKAVSAEFGFKTAIRQAILAGVDVLVFGNNLEYDESVARTTIATLRELLAEGAITEARLRQSIERVRTTLQKM